MRCLWGMLQFHRVAMHTLTLLLQLEGSPAFIHCSSEQCVGLQGECPSMDPKNRDIGFNSAVAACGLAGGVG